MKARRITIHLEICSAPNLLLASVKWKCKVLQISRPGFILDSCPLFEVHSTYCCFLGISVGFLIFKIPFATIHVNIDCGDKR